MIPKRHQGNRFQVLPSEVPISETVGFREARADEIPFAFMLGWAKSKRDGRTAFIFCFKEPVSIRPEPELPGKQKALFAMADRAFHVLRVGNFCVLRQGNSEGRRVRRYCGSESNGGVLVDATSFG